MILYVLFKTYTDDCTYHFEEMLEIFHDIDTAEYVSNELNQGLVYPLYSVKEFASYEKPDCLCLDEQTKFQQEVDACITCIKNIGA